MLWHQKRKCSILQPPSCSPQYVSSLSDVEAYISFPVLTFPVCTLSCWALLHCFVFVELSECEMLHLQDFGKCRLEIETGGIAIDFLHELAHVHKRFRKKAKRDKSQMCSLQLNGAEALILEFLWGCSSDLRPCQTKQCQSSFIHCCLLGF